MARTQYRWGVLLRAAYLWLCPLSRALVGVAARQRGKIDLTCSQIDRQRAVGGAGRSAPINSRRSSVLAPLRPWLWLLLTGPVRLSCPCEKAETAIIRAQFRAEKRKLPTQKIQYMWVMVT